jgi:hypothetical protein
MKVIKPPEKVNFGNPNEKFLFLAGSIEMGNASPWQKQAISTLADTDWTILNPRRDEWDSSWEQSINNPNFKEQVEWELGGLDKAHKIFFYFDPDTKSPVTFLELGLHANSGKAVVCCPDGFWRQGNIEIVCSKFDVPFFKDLKLALDYVLELGM